MNGKDIIKLLEYKALHCVDNILTRRDNVRKKREKRRADSLKHQAEQDFLSQCNEITSPDSPRAILLFFELMNQEAGLAFTEIYGKIDKGWGTCYYLSFRYKSVKALQALLESSPWPASELISGDHSCFWFHDKPPPWPDFWPVRPSPNSIKGGIPAKPLCSDWSYFYFDRDNQRFFIASGRNAQQIRAEHEAISASLVSNATKP